MNQNKDPEDVLSEADYKILQTADLFLDGQIARVLNQNGRARFTVCPHCRVDDFTHVEGCPLIPDNVTNF